MCSMCHFDVNKKRRDRSNVSFLVVDSDMSNDSDQIVSKEARLIQGAVR